MQYLKATGRRPCPTDPGSLFEIVGQTPGVLFWSVRQLKAFEKLCLVEIIYQIKKMSKTITNPDQLLILDESIGWTDLGAGLQRKVMSHDGNLMLVKVKFEKGGIGALHAHPHVQLSYVAGGVFEMTIDGHVRTLKTGDVYYVPSGATHGAVCLEAGELIDIFSPERADFL